MNTQEIPELREIARKLATEIVFAQPGKNDGLLPASSLLTQMEQLVRGTSLPSEIHQVIVCARSWIDELLSADATFTSLSLSRFEAWTAWMEQAAGALEQLRELPPIPSDWQSRSPAKETNQAPANSNGIAVDAEEAKLTLDDAPDLELLSEFLNESAEHLQNIEQGVLVLEENPTDADTLNSIFRAFHTLKGGSGFMNLTAIQTLAHQLESLLDAARSGKLVITPPIVNVILEGGDKLKQFMVEIEARISGKTPPCPIVVPTHDLLARIRTILDEASAGNIVTGSEPSTDPESKPLPPQLKEAADPLLKPLSAEPQNVTSNGSPGSSVRLVEPGMGKVASANAVKVDTNKLDNLVDLMGELVIAQSLVVQNPALRALEDEQLSRDLAQLGRITKELQRNAMSLRMVPIRSTFRKMNRLVRDIAAKTGKQVELLTEGDETELDRTLVEEISDPLVHMIRNAVDHGIEKPGVRLKKGKPEQGSVVLRAFYKGSNIVIEIQDDGGGLDKERLLKKAVEKGIVSPDAKLSDDETFNLIFAAGFSTAEKLTDLSGRGVGMDVVRRNIEKLRGKVEIQSQSGLGSTFRIYLPLTLAIIDGLIVTVAGQRYILPTLSVSESFRPTKEMVNRVNGRGEMISVRGRLRPVLRLHEYLGATPASNSITESIAIVVESGKDSRCVFVDELLGKQEVVIKNLGETFKQSRGLAGAAILGDGRVGLILDPNALVHLNGDTGPHGTYGMQSNN